MARISSLLVVFAVLLTSCGSGTPGPSLVGGEDTSVSADSSQMDALTDTLREDDSTADAADLASSENSSDDQVPLDDVLTDSECVPSCIGKTCGSDGCGGFCGHCEPGVLCVGGLCKGEQICEPGTLACVENSVAICSNDGMQLQELQDCGELGASCIGGECSTECIPDCDGKSCGDNGCGGDCGTCPNGSVCSNGACVMACNHPSCKPGLVCLTEELQPAICGATIDFDTAPNGQGLDPDVVVEDMFTSYGVALYTDYSQARVRTNYWELDSSSGGNSCATATQWGDYWKSPVYVQFLYPSSEGYVQGYTYSVSLYIGNSWEGGIAVELYSPDTPAHEQGTEPFDIFFTNEDGTSFIGINSDYPIGYLYIHEADDPDFTIDDLTFGPVSAW